MVVDDGVWGNHADDVAERLLGAGGESGKHRELCTGI